MWNEPSITELEQLPDLYETESVPLKDKVIHLHFFLGGCEWYVAEYGEGVFFGYVILNGDLDMAEWGNFGFEDLRRLKDRLGIEVDRDLYWKPRKASEISGVKTYE